jgi:phosphoglucosamine mutase
MSGLAAKMPEEFSNSGNEEKKRRYFGTDGIRAVAGKVPLDPLTMVLLGKAIAKLFVQRGGRHRILIGKDTRLSGYMLETALASGITMMGADVLLCGPIPTPGVAYLTRSMRVDAGIMISASHNPFEDNGIKIFGSDGFKLPDEMELMLETLLETETLATLGATSGNIGRAIRIDDAIGRYTVFLKGAVPRQLDFEGLRVGIDAANGAGYVVAPQTFTELGAEVVLRGNSPNGKNINAGFGSLYPEVVASLVSEQNLNIGVALDGDADRAIFVADDGTVLDGDMVLAICAVDQHERGLLRGGKVVATVMSNLGLERYLSKFGITVSRSKVGDRYVLEEMVRSGIDLGGEQSGHTIFAPYSTTGDGVLTALMLTSVMLRKELPLSELIKGYVRFPQRIQNIAVSQKPPLHENAAIADSIAKVERELGESGRVLVRYSGTESKVRVMVECECEDECRQYVIDISEVVEREIGN